MSFVETLRRFDRDKLIHPPRFLIDNLAYATQMGSVAYGVSNDDSDIDIYGFCVPTKDLLFPHLAGELFGFDKQVKRFEQWQEHGIIDTGSQRNYDMTVYSIVKYFRLCADNNPNMIDSLFTPRRCILHSTPMSELMIENRKTFLHKGAMHKLRGYAYSQLSKIENRNNSTEAGPYLDRVVEFENKYGIPSTTMLYDVEIEISRRKLVRVV